MLVKRQAIILCKAYFILSISWGFLSSNISCVEYCTIIDFQRYQMFQQDIKYGEAVCKKADFNFFKS